MSKPICSWCGKRCNNFVYHDGVVGFFIDRQFCSIKCRSYYRNQKKRDNREKEREKAKPQPKTLYREKSPIKSHSNINIPLPERHKTKEEIDLEFYEKQKQLELRKLEQSFLQQQIDQEEQQRQINHTKAKQYLEDGGNKYIYYFKRLWAYLDKPWKKIAFVFIIWSIIAGIVSEIGKLFK